MLDKEISTKVEIEDFKAALITKSDIHELKHEIAKVMNIIAS